MVGRSFWNPGVRPEGTEIDWLDAVLKLSQAGSTVLLLLAVIGAARGLWVPRWIYDEAVKREAAVWVLYEREKATTEKLIVDRERWGRTERSV